MLTAAGVSITCYPGGPTDASLPFGEQGQGQLVLRQVLQEADHTINYKFKIRYDVGHTSANTSWQKDHAGLSGVF